MGDHIKVASIMVALCRCLLYFLLAASCEVGAATHRAHRSLHAATQPQLCVPGRRYVFKRYMQSKWEADWHKNAKAYFKDICGAMQQYGNYSKQWMDAVAHFKGGERGPNYNALQDMAADIFPRFEYEVCSTDPTDDKHIISVPIEPVVGLMRHPGVHCRPEGVKAQRTAVNLDYLLLAAVSPHDFLKLYPGKKYLFDLGMGARKKLWTSLDYFTRSFAHLGMEFDAIFGWEASGTLNHQAYWENMAENDIPRVHFFNIPVSNNVLHKAHPFSILQKVYKPGDYVAFKLDIDAEKLEQELIDHIVANEALQSMISELFF